MKEDFDDEVRHTVPPKGKVDARTRIRSVPHGVNIEIQIRTLGGVTYYSVARDAICGILAATVREGLDVSDVKEVLDEAAKQFFDRSTETWQFGSDDAEEGK